MSISMQVHACWAIYVHCIRSVLIAFFNMKNTLCRISYILAIQVLTKEVNKEQPSYRNLSATATRVLQCTLGSSDFGIKCYFTIGVIK